MPIPLNSFDIEERYLRPDILKDKKVDSSWSDLGHAWLKDEDHGFVFIRLLENDPECNDVKVELMDRSVFTILCKSVLICILDSYCR